MISLHSISVLLFIAGISSWINHRFIKLPSAIGIMSISVIISLILILLGWLGVLEVSVVSAFVGSFNFDELLLHGMLAFLLFAGGLTINLNELASHKGVVGVLSTLGVALSTALTGTLFWYCLQLLNIEIPFVVALLFGAIVSPTDAVAVLGILRKAGVPKSLELKIVGESLFNDGVGVVIFFAVSSLVYGQGVSVATLGTRLGGEILGGLVIGLLLGWITYRMLKAVDDYVVEILLTLALAAGSYSIAELLHASAPIAVVVAGLIIGNQGRAFAMSERTREHLDTFWELIDELLNAVLFVLIGLEVLTLSITFEFVMAGILAIGVILVSRFISVGVPITVLRHWRPLEPHVVKILTWGGLRGGISVALALSLPLGRAHDLLVIVTYVVVLFSVVVQGSTLSSLLTYIERKRVSH